MPGVILGHKNVPIRECRLLCAGRQVPTARLGAHVGPDREGCGLRARHHLRAAVQRRTRAADRRRAAPGRRRRDLRHGRGAGDRRHGARHRDDPSCGHARGSRQRLRRRGQAPAVRPRRHRPLRRPDRGPPGRRRYRRWRALRHRPARPGRARDELAGDPGHQLREARPRDAFGNRAAAEDPSDGRDRRQGVGELRRDHPLRYARGDAGRGRPDRLGARPGHDRETTSGSSTT